MLTNVSLWMPEIYVYVACCRLCYFYVSLIYSEYLANVDFDDIPHTFIPHFTIHSAEKNLHWIFCKLPLDNFPRSATYPFPCVAGDYPTNVGMPPINVKRGEFSFCGVVGWGFDFWRMNRQIFSAFHYTMIKQSSFCILHKHSCDEQQLVEICWGAPDPPIDLSC